MNVVHFTPVADAAAALFSTVQPDTLAILHWPGSVFCGSNCPPERVNWAYCAAHDIPVIYTMVQGASYFYRDGDALYFAWVTRQHIAQRQLLDAVCAALSPAVPGLFVDDNDLRLDSSRCGMSAPELQRSDGVWLNVMEVLLHSDLDEARKALAFPRNAWDHKPVSVLEDWIRPLDSVLGATVESIVTEAVSASTQELLNA